jgi:hypothetical protein
MYQPSIKSTPQAVTEFDSRLVELQRRDGKGKAAVTVDELQALVHSSPGAAHDFVLMRCHMARNSPKNFQPAVIIANLYEMETGETGFVEWVLSRAHEQGADDVVKGISVFRQR